MNRKQNRENEEEMFMDEIESVIRRWLDESDLTARQIQASLETMKMQVDLIECEKEMEAFGEGDFE